MQAFGTPDEVFEAYRKAMVTETERLAEMRPAPRHEIDGLQMDENRFGTLEVEIAAVTISPTPAERSPAAGRSPLTVEIELEPRAPVDEPIVSVSLRRMADGAMVFDVNTAADGVSLGRIDRRTTVALQLERLDAEPGAYRFDVGVYERDWAYVYDYHWQAYALDVVGGGGGFGPERRWRAAASSR
jgi:hypothetical protein